MLRQALLAILEPIHYVTVVVVLVAGRAVSGLAYDMELHAHGPRRVVRTEQQ